MNPPEGDDRPTDPEGPPATVDPAVPAPSGPGAPPDADGDPGAGSVMDDTGPLVVTLVDGMPVLDEDAAGPPRRRRGRKVAVALALLLIAVAVGASLVKVPYYKLSPGSLYATQSLVSVDGAETYPAETGAPIDFTTVSTRKASVLDWLLAHYDEAVELLDAEDFEHGQTPEENRKENLEMMASSKQMAETAALRKLGYPVTVTGTGALVRQLFKDKDGNDLPAATVLKPNDTIVEVDGQPVQLGDDAVKILAGKQPGDTVTLKVEDNPDDPGHEVTTTLVSRCAALPAEQCTPEEEARPLLGVSLVNRDTRFELPFKVDIDTKEVGGPSAGLALTLGLIDVLTPGSLTGGRPVATTGTIDPNGNVGPIGGVAQKTHLVVRNGIPLFLVPPEDGEVAQKIAEGTGTKVVVVKTLDDALAALKENGGSTDVVAEEALARTGTTGAATH
jgi:PDZ domain-containing protein